MSEYLGTWRFETNSDDLLVASNPYMKHNLIFSYPPLTNPFKPLLTPKAWEKYLNLCPQPTVFELSSGDFFVCHSNKELINRSCVKIPQKTQSHHLLKCWSNTFQSPASMKLGTNLFPRHIRHVPCPAFHPKKIKCTFLHNLREGFRFWGFFLGEDTFWVSDK